MKIVITGALGHIGSRLVRELPASFSDLEIVMVDNLSTQRFASLFNLPNEAQYHFVEADVTEYDLEPFLKRADAVVHLAAVTDAASSFDKVEEVERVNFGGTKRVAEACVAEGVPVFHLSTTSVYGTQKDLVDEECSEEDLKPQSPYAESKLREEKLLEEMGHSKGLRSVSCRFGTIFGTSPGMRFHTAVNKFCWQAVMGQPITVWKTAYDQKRPYLDLGDAVRAIAFFIENDLFDCRVYNVVTLNSTVRYLVDHIRFYIPDVQESFVESRVMNQLSYEVVNTRLDKVGFEIQGDLAKGIGETITLLVNSNARSSKSVSSSVPWR